jgi:hypothetical protein
MRISGPSHKCSAAVVMTSVALFATSAYAQDPQPPRLTGLEREVQEMRTANTAIREQLRSMEEQQKALLGLIEQLRQRLDGPVAATAHDSPPPATPVPGTAAQPAPPTPGNAASQAPNQNVAEAVDPYQDSIVLVKTSDDSKVPLLLRLWDVTQLRYTNTLLGNNDFTDHLGVVRPVVRRNDFSLNRNLIQFVGYIFDKRLQFNLIGWASNSSAAFVEGGYISWRFNKAIGIYAGYWGAPGTRSLTGTFPYFVQLDRSMADQFFGRDSRKERGSTARSGKG